MVLWQNFDTVWIGDPKKNCGSDRAQGALSPLKAYELNVITNLFQTNFGSIKIFDWTLPKKKKKKKKKKEKKEKKKKRKERLDNDTIYVTYDIPNNFTLGLTQQQHYL